MVPSSVSVVYTDQHGRGEAHPHLRDAARLAALARRQAALLGVHDERRAGRDRRRPDGGRRHFMLTKGEEHGMDGRWRDGRWRAPTARHDAPRPPTWLLAHLGPAVRGRPDGLGRLQQVERAGRDRRRRTWTLRRRIPAGDGVYNLAASARRQAARRHQQARPVGVGHRRRERQGAGAHPHDAPGAERPGRSRRDNRYAFVTLEGVGSEPGHRGRDRPAQRSRRWRAWTSASRPAASISGRLLLLSVTRGPSPRPRSGSLP